MKFAVRRAHATRLQNWPPENITCTCLLATAQENVRWRPPGRIRAPAGPASRDGELVDGQRLRAADSRLDTRWVDHSKVQLQKYGNWEPGA